ncbi:hypothetical protein QZN31_28265, partial [Burkholderia multivorans]|nr:hypothetical protein [Burkholderia multivorans]
ARGGGKVEKSFDGAAGLQAGDVGHTAREANLLPANEAERAALQWRYKDASRLSVTQGAHPHPSSSSRPCDGSSNSAVSPGLPE